MKNPTANILNHERLNVFPLKIRKTVSIPAFATSVQCLKSRDITLLTKIHIVKSQSYGFSSSHVWMWELAHKEGWVLKNWCFWTVVLEKILESPLDCKEIQPVNPKWNWPWIFIGRTDAETDAPVLYFGQLMQRADSLEKTLMLGKIEYRRRRGWQRMRWLHGITYTMDMNLSKLWEMVKDREAWNATVHWVPKSWTWLSNWAKTIQYSTENPIKRN